MTIQLNKQLADQINQGMDTGGGIELPFIAPYLWVLNGNSQLRAIGGAQYFGGWATKAEDIDAHIEQTQLPIPTGFTKQLISTRDGGDFEAYVTRYVVVAPMALRQSWIADEMHQPAYKKGARRHIQALCYLASKNTQDDKIIYDPWGPVVLTAKGFQARNLLDSFTAWNKHSQNARNKYAPGIPAWCFYVAVGTFSDKPVTKMVGKSSQSPITPIGPFLPKDVGERELEITFVGEPVAQEMANLHEQARDWLKAWSEPSNDITEQEDGTTPPEEPPDDIPF